ncbi:Planctomycete cytochrome C [Polystyrenella longa]|uniref:Planctomycete cytochrome C n=1 Tax=Polystyrenella longa TaxID=2528007 RepID=A0A518CKX8_9PLAN|nr:PSD1 and planctomycete cytochrome C domain-containing protein [Polystyrenella longa]QDU79885.1 Planctomycete cytochrome C [Polystyrenella longa]
MRFIIPPLRCYLILTVIVSGLTMLYPQSINAGEPAAVSFQDVQNILKNNCVKCHGPLTHEGELDLSSAAAIWTGGDSGPSMVKGHPEESVLWERIVTGEMPPESPLDDVHQQKIKDWITAGAIGLPDQVEPEELVHWSFRKLTPTHELAEDAQSSPEVSPVDQLLLPALRENGLDFSPEADRATLLRRASLILTGLPPTIAEQNRFLKSSDHDVYDQIVEYYLNSPHYGERWGKFWLDAAGYADSNGYFNADTPRPLAWKYRDYVVNSFNADKPFTQFIKEQIAGDELSGYQPGMIATREIVEQLVATHYLRNAQDGTDSSDGNPEELRTDRYSALEGTMQIVSSSLLGLTIQCAKCHSHKFEPITHEEYYQFQSVFYPAFNVEKWQKPASRIIEAPLPIEFAKWEKQKASLEWELTELQDAFRLWSERNRPEGEILFADDFSTSNLDLKQRWSATAPGDDSPGSSRPIQIGEPEQFPALYSNDDGQLVVDATQAASEDSWNSTSVAFEWAPAEDGKWVQATFDLIDNRISSNGTVAVRIGYGIALHDYDDSSTVEGGNVIFEGAAPGGGATVYYDLPGTDAEPLSKIGTREYAPGHNYGVRVTRTGESEVQVHHLVDGVPDGKPLKLKPEQLPEGGFGFIYYQDRSFIVDNVLIERTPPFSTDFEESWKVFSQEVAEKQSAIEVIRQLLKDLDSAKPGRIAWVSDYSGEAPVVPLLLRGDHTAPGDPVEPVPFSVLRDKDGNGALLPYEINPPHENATGRRTAWVNWLTEPDSRSAALTARVQVNRLWQHYFGTGIVSTTDNFGYSGERPTNPLLLEYLASHYVEQGWKLKDVHRLILHSQVFKQSGQHREAAYTVDPDNKSLWKYPRQRLNAEAVRDGMLQVAGTLEKELGGAFVPTARSSGGETTVEESTPGAHRRSLYLYQRRTQIADMLQVFDAPKIVFNCTRRNVSTTPLQSLSLMNSEFIRLRASELAILLEERDSSERRIDLLYHLVYGRAPDSEERELVTNFLTRQVMFYKAADDRPEQAANKPTALNPEHQAWVDCCQMLLASNEFLYIP